MLNPKVDIIVVIVSLAMMAVFILAGNAEAAPTDQVCILETSATTDFEQKLVWCGEEFWSDLIIEDIVAEGGTYIMVPNLG